MAFNSQRAAAKLAGEPFINMSAARGFSDGETYPVADTDWADENLTCRVSLGPGQPALAVLPVQISTESKTWQQYKDECVPVEKYLPCGAELTDEITTTLMTISWSSTSFGRVPPAPNLGEPVALYFEIRRSDNTGPRFVAGELVLTERIQ